ncbi:MAG: hypothetical protein FJZ59_06040 [Chlamydiae bacterium]|nr:hypothetical protein [Chlamydiota bacterium]
MKPILYPNTLCTKSYPELIGHNLTCCLHSSVLLVTKEIANLWKDKIDPFGSWHRTLFRTATLCTSLFALIAFLPVSLTLYFLGRVALCFSSLKINNDTLKKIPNRVVIPPEIENTSTKILLETCNDLLPESSPTIQKMLSFPNDEYQRTLKGIGYKFSEKDENGLHILSDELKINVLKRLAEAGKVCVETWRRVASSIFSELFTNPNDIEQTILRVVMDYKDQVALNLTQNSLHLEWHAVSGLKQVIGDDVGFPATREDREDDYGSSAIPILKNLKFLALYHFLHPYKNGNALVIAITASLNLAPNKKEIFNFLFSELGDSETLLLSPEFADYCPSSREIQIKEKGAVYLLKKFGVLI